MDTNEQAEQAEQLRAHCLAMSLSLWAPRTGDAVTNREVIHTARTFESYIIGEGGEASELQ
jgi:hypothetical protein